MTSLLRKYWPTLSFPLAVFLGLLVNKVVTKSPVQTTQTIEVAQETHESWHSMVDGILQVTTTHEAKTVTKVVTRWLRPDGTPRKEQVVDTGQEVKDSSSKTEKKTETAAGTSDQKSDRKAVTVITPVQKDWTLGLVGLTPIRDALHLEFKPQLGLVVTRRLLGDLSGGVFAATGGQVGLVLQIRF